eukprot:GFKZ01006568.1.p1 GENE.GFKZ01006568.1~~GFKZ01006568.1.p1  ORF type:complete len:163 (+),score=15.55 GFKZ01006568.1:1646-2134(+)
MSFWRILGPAPVNSQNAVMTWEWRAIPFPRSLLRRFSPITRRVAMTAGVKGPNLDFLPIVHLAGVETGHVRTAAPEKGARAAVGVGVMNADIALRLLEDSEGLGKGWRIEVEEGIAAVEKLQIAICVGEKPVVVSAWALLINAMLASSRLSRETLQSRLCKG